MWDDLWAALALVLVFEGLLPFASPARWREAMRRVGELGDGGLRLAGAISMLAGLILLFLVRS